LRARVFANRLPELNKFVQRLGVRLGILMVQQINVEESE
jgi:hypothetical protein